LFHCKKKNSLFIGYGGWIKYISTVKAELYVTKIDKENVSNICKTFLGLFVFITKYVKTLISFKGIFFLLKNFLLDGLIL